MIPGQMALLASPDVPNLPSLPNLPNLPKAPDRPELLTVYFPGNWLN